MNGKSWKTTASGIALILAGLTAILGMATGNIPVNATSIGSAITSIVSGYGLVFAKDSNVTGAGSTATTVKPNS